MDIESNAEATISELKDLPLVAEVSHGQFPGGTIGFGVNGLVDFYIDNVIVEP